MNTTIKKGENFMKRFIVSLILSVLIISSFYSVIYATENEIENTVQKEETKNEISTNNTVENTSAINENSIDNSTKEENIVENETTIKKAPVKAQKQTYIGKMYIDDPKYNQTFTVPTANKITLKGWAVSTDSQASLKVYIDDGFVKIIENREKREDVDKSDVVNGYGGTVTTPKAGFKENLDISSLNAGNHTIKIEQLSRNGDVLNSETTKITVKVGTFKGQINIETPTNTKSYLLPDTKTVAVKGWAVSNDSNAILKVYVDNKSAKTIDKRTKRSDVDKAVSGSYGGTTATPKAGFETAVDVSQLSNGNHKIKVEEIARSGAIICKQEITIKITQTKYKGQINIETPTNTKSYSLPDTKTVAVKGWAVSNDSNAILKVYVDNKSAKTIDKRTKRSDVDKAVSGSYGGTTATPKAGFETAVDVSQLSNGNHKIKVEEISRFGAVICKQEITIKIAQATYKGKLNIESKSPLTYDISKTKAMTVKGWSVSNDASSYMIIRIDGVQTSCTVARSKRSDVDKAISGSYGGTAKTPKAGFTITASITKLTEGTHTIEVCEVSRYHKVLASGTIKLKITTPNYKGKMNIETSSPLTYDTSRNKAMTIKGWSVSNDSSSYMIIRIDGMQTACSISRSKRSDVDKAISGSYGGTTKTPKAGFTITASIANIKDGTHTVEVCEVSRYHKVITSSKIQLVTFVRTTANAKGIDVSYYQGGKQGTVIDWNAVRNAGIDFAIIRIGYMKDSVTTPVKDPDFERNYNECKKYGIAVGGYFYSYAINRDHAVTEANHCLSMIQGKYFEMPIFIDIEDPKQTGAIANGSLNRDGLTVIADTFCSILNANGYKSGVYANKYFMQNYLNMSALEKYNVWLAHYTATTDYTGRYDLWQYTSQGSVAGIKGPVDLNWCYRKY